MVVGAITLFWVVLVAGIFSRRSTVSTAVAGMIFLEDGGLGDHRGAIGLRIDEDNFDIAEIFRGEDNIDAIGACRA